jgi:hypothetical protein
MGDIAAAKHPNRHDDGERQNECKAQHIVHYPQRSLVREMREPIERNTRDCETHDDDDDGAPAGHGRHAANRQYGDETQGDLGTNDGAAGEGRHYEQRQYQHHQQGSQAVLLLPESSPTPGAGDRGPESSVWRYQSGVSPLLGSAARWTVR